MAQPDQSFLYQEWKDAAVSPNMALSADLLQKDALHTLGENAAAVLHELRGPLQSVRAHVQLLERKLGAQENDDLTRHFLPIYQSVDHINALMDQFLRLSRLGPATLALLDLQECVQELLPLLRSMAVVRHVELKEDICPAVPLCQGDEQQLKRLLFNLFANACDACEAAQNGAVELRLTREAGEIVLSVCDNGCGISADKLEKIWQPFYTSKVTGTGLGLPSCMNIACEHGGLLTVTSNPGQGSCFSLRLPEKSS